MSFFARNRAGSGTAYMPRLALQGLGDDGDDLLDEFDDSGADLSDNSDTIDTSVPTVSDSDLYEPTTDLSEDSAATGTYNEQTGSVIGGAGVGDGVGLAAGIASLASGISRIFGGGNAQLNATGITSDEEETALPMLLVLIAGAGVLYMALRDQP